MKEKLGNSKHNHTSWGVYM